MGKVVLMRGPRGPLQPPKVATATMVALSRALGHPTTVEGDEGQTIDDALIMLAVERLTAKPPAQAAEPSRCRAERQSDDQFVCDCKAGECPGPLPESQAAPPVDWLDAVKVALPEFSQQDDYLLAHGASLMSEESHEVVHRDTLLRVFDTAHELGTLNEARNIAAIVRDAIKHQQSLDLVLAAIEQRIELSERAAAKGGVVPA